MTYPEGETIYDMAWYPGMSSAEPASCCFVTTARDHPVHLWCAYTGILRGVQSAIDLHILSGVAQPLTLLILFVVHVERYAVSDTESHMMSGVTQPLTLLILLLVHVL